jgi:hypothetical protein
MIAHNRNALMIKSDSELKQDYCDTFNSDVSAMFPAHYLVNAFVRVLVGMPIITVRFAENKKESAPNKIIENYKAHMQFIVSVDNCGTASVKCLQQSSKLGEVAKFRKINAKSEAEAMTKLAAWFSKNQAAIFAFTN